MGNRLRIKLTYNTLLTLVSPHHPQHRFVDESNIYGDIIDWLQVKISDNQTLGKQNSGERSFIGLKQSREL